MLYKTVVCIILAFALSACSPTSSGNAPSRDTIIEAPAISDTDSTIKFAELVLSSNGWEATLDTSDSVEVVTLANGWEVETLSE